MAVDAVCGCFEVFVGVEIVCVVDGVVRLEPGLVLVVAVESRFGGTG